MKTTAAAVAAETDRNKRLVGRTSGEIKRLQHFSPVPSHDSSPSQQALAFLLPNAVALIRSGHTAGFVPLMLSSLSCNCLLCKGEREREGQTDRQRRERGGGGGD